jgi:hypothetical protein
VRIYDLLAPQFLLGVSVLYPQVNRYLRLARVDDQSAALRRQVMAATLASPPPAWASPVTVLGGCITLADGVKVFHTVRQAAALGRPRHSRAGGRCRQRRPSVPDRDLSNPDGETFEPVAGLLAA